MPGLWSRQHHAPPQHACTLPGRTTPRSASIPTRERKPRLFHFGTPAPANTQPSWQGYSVAEWEMAPGARGGARGSGAAAPARSGNLKVVTTQLRPGYVRKNGAPYSDRTVVTEYYDATPCPTAISGSPSPRRLMIPCTFRGLCLRPRISRSFPMRRAGIPHPAPRDELGAQAAVSGHFDNWIERKPRNPKSEISKLDRHAQAPCLVQLEISGFGFAGFTYCPISKFQISP